LEKPSAAAAVSVYALLLFTFHKPSPYLLDVLVGFISAIIVRRGLSSTATTILTFRHERDRLGHHLMLTAFLTVFSFPPALLEPPINDDSAPLAKILPAMFRLLAEHDNVDKADFFF
jgi:hypothetical protein